MPIYDDKKNIVGITGIAREITNRKRAEESLQHRLTMEKVITVIASRLNQLLPESPEEDLLSALNDVGTFLQADRCTCIVLDENFTATSLILQWTMPGVPDREIMVMKPEWQTYPWLWNSITRKKVIRCTRITDLPTEADREIEFWLKNGIVSMLGMPIFASDKGMKALITVETVSEEKNWTDEDEQFLLLVGEMMMTTISRLESERKLKQTEHRYRLLAEQIAAVVYIESPRKDGTITYISPQVELLTGYSPVEWMAPNSIWSKIIHPEDKKRVIRKEKESLGSSSEFRDEYRLITRSGKIIWIEDQMSFMQGEGESGVWHGVMYDITNRKLIEEALSNSKARYQELFEHSPISLWEEDFSVIKKRVDKLKRKCKTELREFFQKNPKEVSKLLGLLNVIHVNQTTLALMNVDSFEELSTLQNPSFNLKPTDLFIEELVAIAEGKTNFEVEAANDLREGVIRYHNLHFMAVPGYERSLERVIIAITDVTDRKLTEEKLTYMSTHDSLTGLFSRSYFEAETERLQVSRQYPISILMVDVDHLKIVNDSEGHAAGDRLIKRTAHVLRLSFRPEDVIARIGGDEFVVITPNTDRFTAAKLVQRLRGMLELENKNKSDLKPLELSMGIATAEVGDLLSDVLKTADYQMYQDKEAKKKQRANSLVRK
jgi:diguanylate cyclase (GGDEF)-like protein/PAS domain S-box-containing protein